MSWVGPALQIGGALFGGLFGGFNKPKIPKELKRIYRFQMSLADQQRRFAQSTPLSTPEEQAYLGQQQGLLGERLQNQREQIYGLYNPLTMGRNAPNQLLNVTNQGIGAQMNLQAESLLSALQQRRQALLSASGIAANAAGGIQYQQQPQVDLAGTFGGLAHAIELNRQLGQQRQDEQLTNFIGAHPAPSVSPTPLGPPAPAGIQGTTTTPFNPVAQVQGTTFGAPAEGMGSAGVFPAPLGGQGPPTLPMPPGVQGGWEFSDPRRRLFVG